MCPSQLKWKVERLTWKQSPKSMPLTWVRLFHSWRLTEHRAHTQSPCKGISKERCWTPVPLGCSNKSLASSCFHSLSPQCVPRGVHDLVSVNSRAVPKFMKRMKVPDYKDKTVFGVPLIVHVQRTGQPLPQSIQQALRYLRSNCLDQVGSWIPGTGWGVWSPSQAQVCPWSDETSLSKVKGTVIFRAGI